VTWGEKWLQSVNACLERQPGGVVSMYEVVWL
jgi:hypothetical protein